MHRRTRRTVFHLAVFIGILTLLILANRPPSTQRTFAWSKIRYQSAARSLPGPRGRCPGLAKSTKPVLVVSHVSSDGDTSWLTQPSLAKKYHLCIYDVDATDDSSTSHLHVPSNRGHEAMAYLTFLIDNYNDIPSAGAVFVHGSRWAWHNDAPDYDNAYLLEKLDVASALQPAGYHNLRCDWSVSTCSSSSTPQGSLQMKFQSAVDPFDARAASDVALPKALAAIFGGEAEEMLTRHETVRSQCCAQFAVSRDRIRSHTKEEYVALRQWLLDGTDAVDARTAKALRDGGVAPKDDRVAGRIVSYIWHILFLDVRDDDGALDLGVLNQAACPSAEECYCKLYGRCNLKCRSPASCNGQYRIPPGYKVPKHVNE
ncbi:DUF3431 domain-containing protein [Aspergillus undulatus]|uniref:DUF3431 domain-containing protein n=1 Tax=Aspergillus undulatus TaxID=1810928 RepID=UPI003CCDD18A